MIFGVYKSSTGYISMRNASIDFIFEALSSAYCIAQSEFFYLYHMDFFVCVLGDCNCTKN